MVSARISIVAAGLAAATLGLNFAHAQPAQPPPAATAAGDPVKGKEAFTTWGCGACHILADAGADGQVGPPLDNNPNLTQAMIVSRIANGQGAMPAFGGQMSEADIANLTAYILKASVKQ